ncbi:sporulation peptidase YabG [Schinkia azotoformans MEV2011]|uniref:Sporulation peptidase YabG n=2 Tax=Schinkia azotoformans TaxID=1454 RepID=K6CW13_SCHAZ|nr:sporulation peptidase YabG [Schinkia azotoformans]EKN64410.1 sporulation peptidase YabG [Schinkia azotoformans LMG 9581]EKN64437.1 sporulation peptidase YabG [Schinkia azotoformans LMG 9581]KEF36407.1 sporulation peptidase YabG [Schinkia azotoformans MEV2011]MEC1640926.1 sporulation peptidase YabG [Schinkia azotoformans]MEC1697644.1 sporulation peptidase YabG [Schinkia azotoformans]
MDIEVGDLVTRKSYKQDLLFRVTEINNNIAILLGEDVRLIADAPISDLLIIDDKEYKSRQKKEKEKVDKSNWLFRQDYNLIRQRNEYHASSGYSHSESYFQMPGRVLHLDGDPVYLQKCRTLYERLGVPIYGVHMSEKEMPERVGRLIEQMRPDILVVTGHDAYLKSKGKISDLKAYRHSRYFAQTVYEARKKVPHLDQLVIFAGACQSHFESLIKAGANFASSPTRINIHALDPVYIVAKISYTPIKDHINVWDVLRNTLTGEKGLGGVETRGLLRIGMPYNISDYE